MVTSLTVVWAPRGYSRSALVFVYLFFFGLCASSCACAVRMSRRTTVALLSPATSANARSIALSSADIRI